MTEEEINEIVSDFNKALNGGEIKLETYPEEQCAFHQAVENYYSKLRYREYSRNDMEMRGFHKNLCVEEVRNA